MGTHSPCLSYTLHGVAHSQQAQAAHPDYVCLVAACAAHLGCLPRHLHEQVCHIEQNMMNIEEQSGPDAAASPRPSKHGGGADAGASVDRAS